MSKLGSVTEDELNLAFEEMRKSLNRYLATLAKNVELAYVERDNYKIARIVTSMREGFHG